MGWFWQKKYDKRDKERKQELHDSTKERVEVHIYACKKDKNILLDKRDALFKLINSAINQTYFVPSEWWYKEYSHLSEIKNLPENSYLNEDILDRFNDLVVSFENELNVINIQIEHYDFLITSYTQTLAALNSSKHQFKQMMGELDKLRQLDTIDFTLSKNKDDGTELIASEILQQENLSEIQQEISELQKNLIFFEEYIKQLKQLR